MSERPALSPRQEQVLSLLRKGELKRLNIFEGSVRSGKTYVSLILWAFWVAKRGEGRYLMAAKTMNTLKRNLLEPLMEVFGEDNLSYCVSKKEAFLFGRRIYLESCADSRAEGRIRGMTLDGAYCDELTLFNEDFFSMLLSRLSAPDAKLFATTNPDHPCHWLKVNYLDSDGLDMLDLRFTLEDNPYLDPAYVSALKAEYKGVYYDRYILGRWVAAEGSIYTDFSEALIMSEEETAKAEQSCMFKTMGIDFGGNKSATVFILAAFGEGYDTLYILDEHYDSENSGAEKLIADFAEAQAQWNADGRLRAAFCDSAEQLLVKSFRQAAEIPVKNALKNPINNRIRMFCRLMASDRLRISCRCKHLIKAIQTAVWDSSRFCDTRLDNGTTDIDSLDAMEYAAERFEKELFRF